ncbi:MAG: DUF3179 domain-containing (seleno)protein [Patescibacteria group bacterium]
MSRGERGLLGALIVLIIAYGVVKEVTNRLPIKIAERSVAEQIISTGAAADAVPAIDDPKFESVVNADAHLSDEGFGIDVTAGGTHRFYPFQILAWHQIVNDKIGAKNIAATYDPLCGSAIVYERGEDSFTTSGSVYNNNLVMQDRATESLWLQLTGEAVSGSRSGSKLVSYPSTVMKWADWKAEYPSGDVLSRKTGAIRDYTSNPYAGYESSPDIYFPLSQLDGTRPSKERVVAADGKSSYWFCFAAFGMEAGQGG